VRGRPRLTTVHRDDAWFSATLDELTSHDRPQDKVSAR